MLCSRPSGVMFVVYIFLVAAVFCQAPVRVAGDTQTDSDTERIPLPTETCSKEDVVCQDDAASLEAIRSLHQKIDDDESGNIDKNESQGFFKEELQNTDGFERQSIFHGKDDKISVVDLWNAWKRSMVYNWTVDDVVLWLIDGAELPMYANLFKEKGINGTYLPRVAVNNHHYISQKLGIKNAVHKHKLSLKAMDVVLFGPTQKPHNYVKDVILISLLVIALCGLWFAQRQNKRSKDEMRKMMRDLDQLQKADESLQEMNEKLQKAEEVQNEVVKEKVNIEIRYKEEIEKAKLEAERLKKEREDSNLEELSRLQLAEEELVQVREALTNAEDELEARWTWGAPTELQQWLQYTFELEQQYFTAKHQAAQRQFSNAREACEKMRRKRTGVFGTLRIAQGNSIDDIDQRILQARMALEEIRRDMQERQQRWQTIERFCGFPIRSNPGMSKLEQALYGDGGNKASPTTVAPMNVEDADEDFPPHFQTATAMLFGQQSNGCMRPSTTFSGISTELKRRHQHMGSSNSLCRTPSQSVVKRDGDAASTSGKASSVASTSSSSSNGHHSLPVSFHLGAHSPTSSPDSPEAPSLNYLPLNEENRFIRSKSMGGMTSTLPGSGLVGNNNVTRIPRLDAATGKISTKSSNDTNSLTRTDSEGTLQRRVLQRQVNTVGSVGTSSQDDDSLSGTESVDSQGRVKDKKKLKLIPKFMRKTEA